jgi:uncharacterized RDD family membrane protein YckC
VVTADGAKAVARESLQGDYSGVVSRLAALGLDAVLSYFLFTLALAAISFSVSIVVGHSVHYSRSGSVVVFGISVVWEFLYFAYCWATTGKTPGMVVLGIRVVRADGAHAEPWRAVVRTLILPISIVFFFVSLPLVLVLRAHQAPHDLAAGTAVVYAWDARAAKWRLLARDSARRQQAAAAQLAAAAEPVAAAQPSATGDATPAAQPES